MTVDAANDLVTVKGTMNVKTLPDVLKEKIKRSVEIVPSKKGEGGGEKKEEEKKGGPKDKGGSEKKEDEKKGGDKEKEEGKKREAVAAPPPAAAAAMTAAVAEANRMDYYAPYPYAGYGYRVEMVHAPQMFSDENPNACAIM